MSNTSTTGKTLEERLVALWHKRPVMNSAEWNELYIIVHRLLQGKHLALVGALPGEEEEFIQDFFHDKVLYSARAGSEIYHCGVLSTYYKHYLLDRLDRLPKRPVDPPPEDGAAQPTDAEANALDKEALNGYLEGMDRTDPRQLGELLELIEMAMPRGRPDAQVSAVLRAYLGIDLEDCVEAALRFINATDEWTLLRDDAWWIRLYLTRHFCPDDEDRVSLIELQRRYGIASYHHKAVKLGISVPKGQDAAMRRFEASYRGRWLASLGIALNADHAAEIAVALKILCLVALSQQAPAPGDD